MQITTLKYSCSLKAAFEQNNLAYVRDEDSLCKHCLNLTASASEVAASFANPSSISIATLTTTHQLKPSHSLFIFGLTV